jgi:ribonuclease R
LVIEFYETHPAPLRASGRNEPKPVPQGQATDRATLAAIARQAMIERGLEPDFPLAAKRIGRHRGPAKATENVRDLRNLLWASIDNDDSRDLDQLTVAESLAGGQVRILVAVADVDALVRKGSALDGHAARNTTSVYTPAAIFPMLPEALSTNLTSLNEDQDRLAIVADMVFKEDGSLVTSELYRAQVHNRAKLAYNSVAAWLTGTGPAPKRIAEVPGLDENLAPAGSRRATAHGLAPSPRRTQPGDAGSAGDFRR